MNAPRRGLFVTFEGGEGAGKSTQARLLAKNLEAQGYQVVMTREPGGTDTAERLRELLLDPDVQLDAMEQLLLFYAARHNHVEQVIRPALQEGAVVICDRFSDSTAAYQGAAGGVNPHILSDVDRLVLAGFKPDQTFLLDLPVEGGADRIAARGEATDRFEQKPTLFHENLRQAFLEIAAADPERVSIVDATQAIDVIASTIREIVKVRLGGLEPAS